MNKIGQAQSHYRIIQGYYFICANLKTLYLTPIVLA